MVSAMARAPLDCPGGWRPVPHLHPGDDAFCEFCGQTVMVVAPPLDDRRDPWPGSKEYRVQAHSFVTKPTPQ